MHPILILAYPSHSQSFLNTYLCSKFIARILTAVLLPGVGIIVTFDKCHCPWGADYFFLNVKIPAPCPAPPPSGLTLIGALVSVATRYRDSHSYHSHNVYIFYWNYIRNQNRKVKNSSDSAQREVPATAPNTAGPRKRRKLSGANVFYREFMRSEGNVFKIQSL